jgi:hypothetical protein
VAIPKPGESNFDVRFLDVDGQPVTVIGPAAAIRALEARLAEASEVEAHEVRPADRGEELPPRDSASR